MLANIQQVAIQVIILFILIAVGFFCEKTRLLNDTTIKGMSALVVNIITPANIINAFQREFKSDLLKGLGLSFLMGFLVFLGTTVIAKLLIHEKDENKRVVLRFASAYPNAGYMGIPLQRAILGDIGVFYCAAYIAMFHIYIWTYGVKLLSPGKERFKLKKLLLNPCIIAIFIGLGLFFSSTTLPTVIASPISSLASLATPIPMIIIGYYLAQRTPKEIFGNGYIYVGALIKMVISPLLALGLCRLFGVHGDLAVSCLIACSASSATMTTMLAATYGRDTTLSAGMISFTTLAAIITMPLFIALSQML